jgi:hypothetical protein
MKFKIENNKIVDDPNNYSGSDIDQILKVRDYVINKNKNYFNQNMDN